jgi:hypothetical protein
MIDNISADTNNPVAFEDDQHTNRGTNNEFHGNRQNTPIANLQNLPIGILGQSGQGYHSDQRKRPRRYTRAERIETLAVCKYRVNGDGIGITDLLSEGLVSKKEQAQVTLKYCLERNILFTLRRRRPQKYYPVCLKSEIIKRNIQKEATGVSNTSHGLSGSPSVNHPLWNALQHQKAQSFLEILTTLAYLPLYIHKLQLVFAIDKQYYSDLSREERPINRAKIHEEHIGRRYVKYTFSPRGTVEVAVATTDTPFKLETEEDESVIFSFLGQVKDRLIYLLKDIRERSIPPIMEWILKSCDLNKDVGINVYTGQFVLPDIQLKHADRVFRLYVKLLKGKAYYRVEESLSLESNIPVIEALDNIRHPYKSIEAKLDKLMNLVKNFDICMQEQDRQKRERGQ